MKRKIALLIAIILWSGAIFMFSAQCADDSKALSKNFAEKIVSFAKIIFGDDFFAANGDKGIESLIGLVTHYLRKTAHFFLFFVLGIFCYLFILEFELTRENAFKLALVYCFLYAVSDEIHQLFVPGRAGMVRDVLLDTCGSLIGIGICKYIRSKRRNKERK